MSKSLVESRAIADDYVDPLGATMHGMLNHPAFDHAASHYLTHILIWRRQMGVFNRVATTSGLHTMGYVLFLYFANTTGNPENGATYSRLLDICEQRGNCGSRALRTTLILAQVMGYLQSSRGRADRRIQIFTPSEKLIAQSRQQFTLPLACLDKLVPGAGLSAAAASDPAFLPKVFTTAGKAFLDQRLEITEFFPDLHALMQFQGGCPAILSISNSVVHERAIQSSTAIGKEFHVSAAQVRAVLKAAADRGLVTLSERGQVVHAAPLVAKQKAMIARELALYAKFSFGLEEYFCGFRTAGGGLQDVADRKSVV